MPDDRPLAVYCEFDVLYVIVDDGEEVNVCGVDAGVYVPSPPIAIVMIIDVSVFETSVICDTSGSTCGSVVIALVTSIISNVFVLFV